MFPMFEADGSDVVDVVVVVQLVLWLVLQLRFVYVSHCFVLFGFASVRERVLCSQGLNLSNGLVTTVAATFELLDLELLVVPVVAFVAE